MPLGATTPNPVITTRREFFMNQCPLRVREKRWVELIN
jgi:hypothetical protein